MRRRHFLGGHLVAVLVTATVGCGGGSDVIVDDDGVSSGGVKIETIDPAAGPLPGGQRITITGTGFTQSGTQVIIGDSVVDSVAINSNTELEVRTPAGVDPAAVDVVVFTDTGFASRTNGYSYNPLPTVVTVADSKGPAGGGNAVTITGTGFQDLDAGNADVRFGPYRATDVTVMNDTTIAVTAPSAALEYEVVDVVVTNNNGPGELANGYTFQSPGFLAVRSQVRTRETGELYHISAVTGSATLIAGTRTASGDPLFFTAIAFDPADDTLFGAERVTNSLYTIDPTTGIGTLVGPFGADTTVVGGLSFRGGVLYGLRRQPIVRLFAIDKATGTGTDFNTENLSCCGSMTTNSDATTTFFTVSGGINTVDIATGVQGNTPVPITGDRIRGLAFLGNQLFGTQKTNLVPALGGGGDPNAGSRLLKIDPVTGETELLGLVPRICGMATLPN